jgi:hypothetical protein
MPRRKGTPAASVLANGILGWRPPRLTDREVRMETLFREVGHHLELCPCRQCKELRSL